MRVIGLELARCHPSGSCNSEVAATFVENLCFPVVLICLDKVSIYVMCIILARNTLLKRTLQPRFTGFPRNVNVGRNLSDGRFRLRIHEGMAWWNMKTRISGLAVHRRITRVADWRGCRTKPLC